MPSSLYGNIQKSLSELSPHLPQGHALKRLNSLSALISGMITKGKSHLSKIGSGLPQEIHSLSQEIHAKRFLENKYTDYKVHYLPYLPALLSSFNQDEAFLMKKQDLKLVIDGSQMGSKFVVLMLSVVVGKRAIPIFWVVKKGKKGHFPSQMHVDVVRSSVENLRSFLNPKSIITLLGDGEFDSVELQKCCQHELQIDYVLRTASDSLMYENGDGFQPKNIKLDSQTDTLFIPAIEFTKEKFKTVHFLYWFDQKVYDKPLFLISTFDNAPDIMEAYKQRFSIETLFKDFKSRGFNLHQNRLQKENAVNNLIMVAALAFCFLMNFGKENQDNSLKIKVQRVDKNVNSIFSFAILLLQYAIEKNIQIDFCPNLNKGFYQKLNCPT